MGEASLVSDEKPPRASNGDISNDDWTRFVGLAVYIIITERPEARPRFIHSEYSDVQGQPFWNTSIIFSTADGDRVMTTHRIPDISWGHPTPVPADYQYPDKAKRSYFIWRQVVQASRGLNEVASALNRAGAFIEYEDYYSTVEIYEERISGLLQPWWHFSNPVSLFGARYQKSCVNALTTEIDLGCEKILLSQTITE